MNSLISESDPRVRVRLMDLGLAPENLRATEPADEDVPRLADTITAAGLIYPPLVRKGRKGELPYMVLDGRRRRFALLLLVERGDLTLETEIECRLATGKAAQAAAAVLAAEQAPVHLADVIQAIGKLRRSRMNTAAIAAALGYGEVEVKRLEALAAVHPTVLLAFRQGRLTLRQLRLFARLKDRRRQAELAETALAGYFHDYQLQGLVSGGRVTDQDPRFGLVGEARYTEAGGRLRPDLFGELPTEVLDADILDDCWRTVAATIAGGLAAQGIEVLIGRDRGFRTPDGLEPLPFVYWGGLPEDRLAAFEAARERIEAAANAVSTCEPGKARDAALPELLEARLALAGLTADGGEVRAVLLSPASDGLDAVFFQTPPVEVDAAGDDEEGDGDDRPDEEEDDDAEAWRPEIETPDMDVAVTGLSHVQHEVRTDLATRGLIRDLADHPEAAMIALTAQLLKHLALQGGASANGSALAVSADAYRRHDPAVESLDGVVRTRLAEVRTAYRASGLRPIPFVAALDSDARQALLATLVAATLNLREPRTTEVRRNARAEAVEIAALCGADPSRHWTPEAAFLAVHAKPQLLGFLDDMDAREARHATLKKDELVAAVAAAAAERQWTPACVHWDRAADPSLEGAVEPPPVAEAA